MISIQSNLRTLFIILSYFIFSSDLSAQNKIAGVLKYAVGSQDGYTLFSPVNTKETYLIDNCGRVINKWMSSYNPGNALYLLPDGNLLRTAKLENTVITGGGGGGRIELFDWESNLIWYYNYNSDLVRHHHDVTPLPNGNILLLAWDIRSQGDAIAAGRNPALIVDGVIWSEHILEIKPTTPGNADIVWQWNLWDHLIQDFDNTKSNFGDVSINPHRININFAPDGGKSDWIHANALDYHQVLDQIVISTPFFDEFWIIDHSTTTEQAATSTGGLRGKGGDILYRWGNPLAYKQGLLEDRKLLGQHRVHWIDIGLPDENKILYFNNGPDRPEPRYSSVEIMVPPLLPNGTYELTGNVFGPLNPNRIYTSTPKEEFYSRILSGAEMLSNGNLLICSSLQGRIFEVNNNDEIVWEYRIPITRDGIVGRDYFPTNGVFTSDPAFRATRYSIDYEGFNGKNIFPGEPIEGEPFSNCSVITGLEEESLSSISVSPNPASSFIEINSLDGTPLNIEIISFQGRILKSASGASRVVMSLEDLPSGLFLVRTNNDLRKIIIRH